MVSEVNVIGKLIIDDTDLQKKKVILNQVAQRSQEVRSQVMRDMATAASNMTQGIQAFRLTLRILRVGLDPIHSAILNLITTTVSNLAAIAAAYYASVVGIPVAAVVSAAAIGLQFGVLAETLQNQERTSAALQLAQQRADAQYGQVRAIISGLGGP